MAGADAREQSNGGDTRDSERQPGQPAAVDVAQLADKVYRLMKDALRLEQSRGAGSFTRRNG
jgi:hypothetical protein